MILYFKFKFEIIEQYSSSLYELKSFYRQVKLPPIASTQQVQFLERICTKLQIPYEVSGLTALVASGEGDLRFVLNSLHSIVFSDGEVTLKSVKKDVMNKKDVIQSIDDYFNLIFICSRAQGSIVYQQIINNREKSKSI